MELTDEAEEVTTSSSTKSEEDCFSEGHKAFDDKVTPDDCPYLEEDPSEENTASIISWLAGWSARLRETIDGQMDQMDDQIEQMENAIGEIQEARDELEEWMS